MRVGMWLMSAMRTATDLIDGRGVKYNRVSRGVCLCSHEMEAAMTEHVKQVLNSNDKHCFSHTAKMYGPTCELRTPVSFEKLRSARWNLHSQTLSFIRVH
jgi:hypothetical protein